ncbi:dihydrolipoyl dehydrogenase family protein [Anabaena subtropica]|uniref:NAD(P)/FAD-dependent oxidoreductase n=1 Tax=Anabaena subtropica FACHB-260 TaxID=2692884 RepID=A0ABR8CS37_9NOST|nr:NAD(P)/FAD-dependent oxidoreductase [Anabaena subtropica]MBD2345209.1 NAD(P)/FAD-dependent oxidoreductase [Anabaena subtropica FACHB-260]
MTIDYDVVIIGGSLAGRYAALTATQLRAKVALVESQINNSLIFQQAVGQIANLTQKFPNLTGFGINTINADTSEKCQISVAWAEAMLSAPVVVSNIQEQLSVANLAAQGVDVIVDSGQFQTSPHLAFAVNHRLLRGRTYLIASGSLPAIPKIEGLQATGYLTPATIWQSLHKPDSLSSKPPQNWVIIGGSPQSIEISQTLARLGCSVTLVVKSPHLLPHIDSEIAQLLLTQLEVDGVRVLTQKFVTQVRRIDDQKWIQAGEKAIEADEILVATGQQPNIESLNLSEVGVKWHQHRLLVNGKLQTTNRRIYACGDVIGGYEFPHIANYEAKIALNNALFFPRLQVNYQCLPWAILSYPTLAQVGLTENQAKRQFDKQEVLVLQHYYKSIAAAQLRNEITGVCKLVVLRNGEILGATIFGTEARELINLVALAMSQKISVKHLGDLSAVYPSFSEILEQTAQEFIQQRFYGNGAWQDWLEGLFYLRRNWNL